MSTEVINWEDDLAKFAVESAEAETSSQVGSWMSTQGGHFTYQDVDIGKSVSVIVAAALHENQYYDVPFNAAKPRSPVCYAFGTKEEDMAPHPDSESPQSDSCATCERNKWPKERGQAKECKNVRRLGLIPANPNMTPEDISRADVAWLKVPVMSVKNWSAHTRVLKDRSRPPFAQITQVGIVPDKKSQFLVTFKDLANLEQSLLGAAKSRHIELMATMAFGYRRNEESTAEVTEAKQQERAKFGKSAS